jgi:hypothetical protein
MRKFDKEKQQYVNVSRYLMLTKVLLNDSLIEGTIIGFDEETDMTRVRLSLYSNTTIDVWFNDEEIYEYYHAYIDRKAKKKKNREQYKASKRKGTKK